MEYSIPFGTSCEFVLVQRKEGDWNGESVVFKLMRASRQAVLLQYGNRYFWARDYDDAKRKRSKAVKDFGILRIGIFGIMDFTVSYIYIPALCFLNDPEKMR